MQDTDQSRPAAVPGKQKATQEAKQRQILAGDRSRVVRAHQNTREKERRVRQMQRKAAKGAS